MSDRRLALRAAAALVLANLRYWSSVAPLVRRELERWSVRATAIPDPSLRNLAMCKLDSEQFNAEVAATLATLAPRAHRSDVVEAIVALEVLYDYLDGLTERPVEDPLRDGFELYRAFTSTMDLDGAGEDDYLVGPATQGKDGGYPRELSETVRAALRRLPARQEVLEVAAGAVARCAEAQVRVHAAPRVGRSQLERWARTNSARSGLEWREYLAGAVASVLAAHALIALAATAKVTVEEARATDGAYLSISALSTMLDSLIDYEHDLDDGDPWLVRYYQGRRALGDRLAQVAKYAVARVGGLPDGPHHLMTMVGVAAYYSSASEARREPTAALLVPLRRELRPLLGPTLAVMRTWRLAKRLRALRSRGEAIEDDR